MSIDGTAEEQRVSLEGDYEPPRLPQVRTGRERGRTARGIRKRGVALRILSWAAVAALLSGCAAKRPAYQRPSIDAPGVYRGTSQTESTAAGSLALGDQKWPEVFRDDQLQQLIRTALERNHDLRIAATRILQAQAQVDIARADQLPTVVGSADLGSQRTPQSRVPAFHTSQVGLGLAAVWDLDFWGKFRSATEAARADLLASEWARRAVTNALIADVASSYFRLRGQDMALEISQRTLQSRQESLRLTQDLSGQGIVSLVDVRQAEQLVLTASVTIPDLERQIEQEENRISVLLGNNPGPVPRGLRLTEQVHSPAVPAGLPSTLLERRPDIMAAEQQLVAFNARIAAARTAYFPQIELTATGGFRSSALGRLFSGAAGLWSFVGGLTQPIFSGGRIRAGVRIAEAQEQEALLIYQQTIQRAFQEVSDALVSYRKTHEVVREQESLVRVAQETAQLTDARYRGGVASYLEVLTIQSNFFSAELALSQARAAELEAFVQLYRALGGGWQQ